jgi:transcriptional regulator with XRE-family HTH domain
VGLSTGIRRRTPGLRREELATVAGVGVTWYTWLEQGRDIRVSGDTLERIANALRLTQTDVDYLFSLSGVARAGTRNGDGPFELDKGIQRVLDAFQGPAFVVGPDWDVEAFNRIADKVYQLKRCSGRFGRNHVWRFFMDPARRALYLDWEVLAGTAVGLIRAAYARRVGVPRYESLLQTLCADSPEFKTLWSEQRTSAPTPNLVRLLIPRLGEVHVMSTRLPLPGSDDHLLFLLPPVDEKSTTLMARLARRK